jgi:hypothetical protein
MTRFPLQRCFRHCSSRGATDDFAEAFRFFCMVHRQHSVEVGNPAPQADVEGAEHTRVVGWPHRGVVALIWRRSTYVQGNRPAMNRRKATLANSSVRETSARTQPANSFIVSLRLGDGLGIQIFVPFEFWRSVCSTPWANPLQKFSLAKLA